MTLLFFNIRLSLIRVFNSFFVLSETERDAADRKGICHLMGQCVKDALLSNPLSLFVLVFFHLEPFERVQKHTSKQGEKSQVAKQHHNEEVGRCDGLFTLTMLSIGSNPVLCYECPIFTVDEYEDRSH